MVRCEFAQIETGELLMLSVAWSQAEIEILIHPSERSSGGLLRLLKSLEAADFISDFPPRITIDLSPVIDAPTQEFLKDFRWPPHSSPGLQNTNRLTLRHRVRPLHVSHEDEAVEFIESFFPFRSFDSHVLVLSSQAELSPLFYHYIKYALLEYKYSAYGSTSGREDIVGISLELPAKYLNDSMSFSPPAERQHNAQPDAPKSNTAPHFLWQAPNSNAALYFGEKWTELHDFVRRRLEAQRTFGKQPVPRLTSVIYPKWMEYVLELCRLRDYYLLYPQLGPENAVVAVHNELFHSAEDRGIERAKPDQKPQDGESEFIDTTSYLTTSTRAESQIKSHSSLLSLLPSDGDLPELLSMDTLSSDGTNTSLTDKSVALAFANIFKREMGGCGDDATDEERKEMSTADLFCVQDNAKDEVVAPAQESHNEGDRDK